MEMKLTFMLIISFVASFVRSTLGFGASLIAVPLFLLFLPVDIAVPLSVMLSIVIALIIVIQDHKEIYFNSAKWLIIYAILGIPLGAFILTSMNENVVKVGLGILLIVYSIYRLCLKNNNTLKEGSKLWIFICGFLSGVFGGAYGLNGPPLVVYGNLMQWSAKHFRATLQAYFLPVSLFSVLVYYSKGLITTELKIYFGVSLITTIPAIFLGRYINRKLKNSSFFEYVYWGLIAIGAILVFSIFM